MNANNKNSINKSKYEGFSNEVSLRSILVN